MQVCRFAGKGMRQEDFEKLTERAISRLPAEFRDRLENVDIVVEDWPSTRQLGRAKARGRMGLLGLYEGVPRTSRGRGYNMVLPDKITIFRRPIEARCGSSREVEREIERVVRHEIAHHFGMGEDELRAIEGGDAG
ncbi:metallopeptidase family protein [Chloroflexota bacterium]